MQPLQVQPTLQYTDKKHFSSIDVIAVTHMVWEGVSKANCYYWMSQWKRET